MFVFKGKKESGIALVMAIMILSLVMLVGLILNNIVLNEVKISVNTANVVGAYYAAESGVERALYYLTAPSIEDNIGFFQALPGSNPSSPDTYTLSSTNATYSYATTSIKAPIFTAYNLNNTNPAHVSIVNPSGDIGEDQISWSEQSGGVRSYLNWRIDNCFPQHGNDRLEITQYSFDQHFANPDISKFLAVCNCSFLDDSCQYALLNDLSSNRYYKFVFRPMDGDVQYLEFDLSPDSILSEAMIQVDGRYHSSQYRLQANLSAIQPSSDIFNYVVFSEEEIIKD